MKLSKFTTISQAFVALQETFITIDEIDVIHSGIENHPQNQVVAEADNIFHCPHIDGAEPDISTKSENLSVMIRLSLCNW